MAHLKDFYHFDIDYSVQNMYFLKWSMSSDILLLEPFSITNWKGRFAVTIGQDIKATAILKALQK